MRAYALAAVFTGLVSAAETPDARSLLADSAKALSAFPSYKMEQHMTIDMRATGLSNKMSMDVRLWVQPGKFRMAIAAGPVDTLAISDGNHTYLYLSPKNQYLKRPAVDSPEKLGEAIMPGMAGFGRNSPDSYESAQAVREESVSFDGREIPCHVVEAKIGKMSLPAGAAAVNVGKQTLWIEKERKVVLKQAFDFDMVLGAGSDPMQAHQEMTMTKLEIGPAFSPGDFVFTPPPGAKEVENLPGMPSK